LLGRTAAARGVLLGRYPRCDGGRLGVLCDPAISRVHALVIEIAGAHYVIDAGSTNGVWIGADRARMARLIPGLTVALAGGIATLEWNLDY
ncbi:MAG: FHA domain-containing protein, partial [Acidimicrobiales bacterium]